MSNDRASRAQRAVEKLYEDERLRSNLTDQEASVLLGWGAAQIEQAAGAEELEAATQRVWAAAREINGLEGEERHARVGALTPAPLPKGEGGNAPAPVAPAGLPNPAAAGLDVPIQAERARAARPAGGVAWLKRLIGLSILGVGLLFVLGGCQELETLIDLLATPPATAEVGTGGTPSAPLPPTPGTATATPATWYQVYFTAPKYPATSAGQRGGLDEKLAAFIDGAQQSVDMAIYQLDLENVTQALLNAELRGCTVRVVTDVDIVTDPQENPSFVRLQKAGIRVSAGNPNAIMHDKFVVVDGRAVWTGSWNFTTNDTYRYNNNAVVIQNGDLAKNYTATFEKMWRDKKFGPARLPGGVKYELTIGRTPVENYFAPEDDVDQKIVAWLERAEKSIDFMAFSFTDDNIGAVLLAKAKAGVTVRGVFETTGSETQFSEYGRMKAAGLDVWQDGNPYLMHHKVFIIDAESVIFGSFNFSQNAAQENDENLLIVDSNGLADRFVAEFGRVYAQAKNPPKK